MLILVCKWLPVCDKIIQKQNRSSQRLSPSFDTKAVITGLVLLNCMQTSLDVMRLASESHTVYPALQSCPVGLWTGPGHTREIRSFTTSLKRSQVNYLVL